MQEQAKSIQGHGNVSVHYRITRPHTPRRLLVLLHGLASNMTRWSEFIEHTKLHLDWDILRVDLRGHGLSFTRGAIGMKIWCNDIALILDTEGYRVATMVGHSMGAQLAIHFNAMYPEKLAGVVMIDPVLPQHLQGSLLYARRMKYFVWCLVRLMRITNRIGIYRRHINVRDLKALDAETRQFLHDNPRAEISRLYANPFSDMMFIPTANYLQDIYEVICELPPLETIVTPVLVLFSSGAAIIDIEKNKASIRHIPNVQIEFIDADHWALTEKPNETRHAIEAWCDQLLNPKQP